MNERYQFQPGQQVEVTAYRAARDRCRNPKNPAYHNYGERGIEFRFTSFREFWDCLGPRPQGMTGKNATYSLERIDNNGHYEPGNVKWATRKEQCNNKRTNRKNYSIVTDKDILRMLVQHPYYTYKQIAAALNCSIGNVVTVVKSIGAERGRGQRPKSAKGETYGKWTVIGDRERHTLKVLCRCACGTERPVRLNNLRSGKSTNCGCAMNEMSEETRAKHQAWWTPERRKQSSDFHKAYLAEHPDHLKAMHEGTAAFVRSKRKLTDDQVLEMRRLRREGLSLEKLGRMFHVGANTVRQVVNRVTYKNVEPEKTNYAPSV